MTTHTFTFKITLPGRIDRVLLWLVLLYRRLRYGYTFRKIRLSKGKYAIVDNCDFDRLSRHKWCTKENRNTYYARRLKYSHGRAKPVYMHREIMNAPQGLFVDHINHNGLDNRRSNLRIVTAQQNSWNKRRGKIGSSKYKGVSWDKKKQKWQVGIRIGNKSEYLGRFEHEKEAAAVYNAAARKRCGEYAFLNFDDD